MYRYVSEKEFNFVISLITKDVFDKTHQHHTIQELLYHFHSTLISLKLIKFFIDGFNEYVKNGLEQEFWLYIVYELKLALLVESEIE